MRRTIMGTAARIAPATVMAIIVWTLLVTTWLLTDPLYIPHLLSCQRYVGPIHSAACDAAQAAVNEAYGRYHVTPMLLAFGAGYVAIVVVAAISLARSVVSRHRT